MTLTNILWLFTGQLVGLVGGFFIARYVFTEAGRRLAEKYDRESEENKRLREALEKPAYERNAENIRLRAALENAFALLRRHGILENHERN